MKKVIAASIVELLLFDKLPEMYTYVGKLRERQIEHECHWHRETDDGKILLCISKAYNKSQLIRKEDTEMDKNMNLLADTIKIIMAVMLATKLILTIKKNGEIQQTIEKEKQQKAEARFYTPDINTGIGKIIVDKETDVCYYWKKTMNAGGMTILVDAEGKPIIWEEDYGTEE